MSEQDIAIPGEQLGRQAMAAFGGYLHQLLATVAAWMRLKPGETLLIEVAEDFAVVAGHVIAMTQVKRESPSRALSLRREDARKAILSLWQFSSANPDRDVRLHFLTTANPGHEQGVDFPDGLTGVGYWARVALGADVEPLRAFLLTLEWPVDLARFLAEADGDQIRVRLVSRIQWFTGADTSPALIPLMESRLGQRALSEGMMASDGARALPVLILRAAEAVLEDRRSLAPEQFEEAWQAATNIPMPISAVRRFLAMGAEGGRMPQPLLAPISTPCLYVSRPVLRWSTECPSCFGPERLFGSMVAAGLASHVWPNSLRAGPMPAGMLPAFAACRARMPPKSFERWRVR